MPVFIAAVVFGGLVALFAILRGAVFALLWSWFVTPEFGLHELALPEAIGLVLLISYVTHQVDNSESKRGLAEQLVVGTVNGLWWAVITLVMAYVAHGALT